MNTYLLGLAAKWGTILCVSVTGLFSSSSLFSEMNFEVKNLNQTKNTVAGAKVVNYETTLAYNQDLPQGTVITKQEGKPGLAYVNIENNVTQLVSEPTNEIVEIGTGKKTEYVGKMTGYGADCVGCSGNLSCRTKQGSSWNLINNGTTYNDEEYVKVRILAAALDNFPCGTIIEVVNPNLGTFNAIVLDTGGDMRKAWNNGIVHMDLAFNSESNTAIYQATGTNVIFNVKRWGW